MLRMLQELYLTLWAAVVALALTIVPIAIVGALFGNPAGGPWMKFANATGTAASLVFGVWITRKLQKKAKELRERRERAALLEDNMDDDWPMSEDHLGTRE